MKKRSKCVVCGGPTHRADESLCRRCESKPWEDPKIVRWLFELGVTADEPAVA